MASQDAVTSSGDRPQGDVRGLTFCHERFSCDDPDETRGGEPSAVIVVGSLHYDIMVDAPDRPRKGGR